MKKKFANEVIAEFGRAHGSHEELYADSKVDEPSTHLRVRCFLQLEQKADGHLVLAFCQSKLQTLYMINMML